MKHINKITTCTHQMQHLITMHYDKSNANNIQSKTIVI